MASIDRNAAKIINLGLSYGMGVNKLSKQLGVSTPEAKELIKKYHEALPFLSVLNKRCMATMSNKKGIRTLGGRISRLDPPLFDKDTQKMLSFEYKGLNKLIQGSAADQVIEAMIKIDKAGIPMLFSVHDEICLSLKNRADAGIVKEIMENCVDLEVPMLTDIGEGKNWSKCK
jgi:DNA polymerase-1